VISQEQAQRILAEASGSACERINAFSREVLNTRGGRIGSGMGALMESLWGYNMNQVLKREGDEAAECELAWMYGHEYNDFACVICDSDWDPNTMQGELLRIEAKSMVASADESKAHFDQLYHLLGEHDLLLIIVWDWISLDGRRVTPQVLRHYIGAAKPLARLRDKLHMARGGSFIEAGKCPDGCDELPCRHVGEPINASGKRERLSGPESLRVSRTVSYAANFGGMVRMLKTNSEDSRAIFRGVRKECATSHAYISFIHDCFPDEEKNQYTTHEWQEIAEEIGLKELPRGKGKIVEYVRRKSPTFREHLRNLGNA
jgi:hypothetical protein